MPAVSLLLEPYDPPQNEEEIFANIQAQDDYAQAGIAQATASAAVLQGVEIPEAGGEQATGTATGAYGPPAPPYAAQATATAAPSPGPVYAVEPGGAGVAEGTAGGVPGGPAPEYAAQATAGASPGPVYAVEPTDAGVEQARAQAGVEGEDISPITGPVGGAFTGTVLSEARTRPEGYEPEDTSDLPYRGKALPFVLPQYRSGAIPQVTDDLPASFRATDAIKRIRQFGLPVELFAIAQTYFDPESGPGFYDPQRNAVAIGKVGSENTPYGQMVPIHETLHAFEFNLTPEERARLEAILAKYPLPSGTPAEHHPIGGKDIYGGTGLPSYFDYIFADYVANGDFNAAPPPVPVEITRFIQEMAPIVSQRLKDQGKGQAPREPTPDPLAAQDIGPAVGGAVGGTFAAPPDVIPIDPYQKVTPEQIVDMERRGYIFDYDENGQSVFRKANDSAELARAIIGTQTAIHGLDVGRNLFSGDIVGAQAPLAEALGDAADVLGLPRGVVAAAAQIAPQNGIELLAAGLVPGLSPAADAADVLRLVRGAGRAASRGAINLSQAYETSARSGLQTAGVGPRPKGITEPFSVVKGPYGYHWRNNTTGELSSSFAPSNARGKAIMTNALPKAPNEFRPLPMLEDTTIPSLNIAPSHLSPATAPVPAKGAGEAIPGPPPAVAALRGAKAAAKPTVGGGAAAAPTARSPQEALSQFIEAEMARQAPEAQRIAEAGTAARGAGRIRKPPTGALGGAGPPGPPKPPTGTGKEGFAANIRLSKYPDDIQATIKTWADANPDAVQAARRGVRSDEQVLADARALVDEMGGDFGKIQKKWKPGDAWNAEEVTAIRGTLREKTEAVLDAAAAARSENSAANYARLITAIDEQARVQEIVHGITAESGRSLRAFRQEAFDAIASNDNRRLEELLKRVGDRGKLEDMADAIANLDLSNPVAVSQFLRNVQKPGLSDYLMEVWINSILSGPKTHIVNALSNTVNTLMSPLERTAAAGVERVMAPLQGRQVARFFSEAPADLFGAVSGIDDGVRAALATLKNGITPTQASKWEFRRTAFRGKLGSIIRAPGTMLEAADSLNYSINYRAALSANAVRQAKREGLNGQGLAARIAELKADPTPALLKQSAATAEYRLFRAPPGEITAAVMQLRDKVPGARFVLPFLRTPANLFKFGIERSPVAFLNIFDGGMWRNLARQSPEASDQIARALIGTTITAAVVWQVAEGNIEVTGATPMGSAERDRFFREGKSPFAVRIGDTWIQYQRLEPWNQALSQAALIARTIENGDEKTTNQLIAEAATTIGNNLVSQTYLSGLSEFIESIRRPAEAGARFGERTATGFVPFSSALRTAAQMTDPTFRRPENILEQLKTGLPTLSRQVPPRLTAFGEEARRESPAFSPIQITPAQQSAVDAELERLDIEVGFVGTSIAGHKLTREEQFRYQELAGQVTFAVISALVESPAYQGLTPIQKEKAIDKAIQVSRDRVRDVLLKEAEQKARELIGAR